MYVEFFPFGAEGGGSVFYSPINKNNNHNMYTPKLKNII
jgi:hypothetical protein